MLKRIDIALFRKCLDMGNRNYIKAIIFAMQFKTIIKSSVIKGYTIRKMASIMGSSHSTINKYIPILMELGIVRFYYKNGIKYMKMGKLKHSKIKRGTKNYFTPSKLDILIPNDTNIMNTSVMRKVFCALYIKLVADEKAYYRNCTKSDKKRRNNHPKRCCAAAPLHNKYADFGLARTTIRQKLNCGNTMVSKAIKYGDDKLFLVARRKYVFNVNEKPFNNEYAIEDNHHEFFNRLGQYCICFSNCYFSTLPQYYKQSVFSQLEIQLG